MPYESRSFPRSSLFLGAAARLEPGRPVLHGVPYDGTACFRPGARFGPDAIRAVSDGLESYSPRLDHDLIDSEFYDCGNLDITYHEVEKVVALVEQTTESYLQMENVPVMIGGEHSITPGAVAAVARHYPGLAVLQLDAHADLRESWTGTKWSHACAMRRVLDVIPGKRLLQCGIRSGTREEFFELRDQERLVEPSAEALADALARLGAAPLLSVLPFPLFFCLSLSLFSFPPLSLPVSSFLSSPLPTSSSLAPSLPLSSPLSPSSSLSPSPSLPLPRWAETQIFGRPFLRT